MRTSIVVVLLLALQSFVFAVSSAEYQKACTYLKERGEVYFEIFPAEFKDLKPYLTDISIDRVEQGHKVVAYAAKQGFEKIHASGMHYSVQTPPCFRVTAPMSDYRDFYATDKRGLGKAAATNWYRYPTFDAFKQIMDKFHTDHPQLTQLTEIGKSVRGREILLLRVTADIAVRKGKPRFFVVSTVHGDELLNYMSTLHMIDTLLSNYSTNQRFTRLLDEAELWFVPLFNPDGTYLSGNNTVQGARRYNANNVDVNRNYPCPCGQGGNHAVYGLYSKREPESAAIMTVWDRTIFHMATDLHSGFESTLWPYGGMSKRPCDEDWYKWTCKRYVDQVHIDCNNNGYMKGCGGDGMGNIFSELYECHGTSVDYAIFHKHCRMIPIETSSTKMLAESELQRYWGYTKEGMLQFYELLLTGIQGTVTNSVSKEPILGAKVHETQHDRDSAWVYTDSAGFYLRFIDKGSWTLTFSRQGYTSKSVNVTVDDLAKKYPIDVELDPVSLLSTTALPMHRSFKLSPLMSGILLSNSTGAPEATVSIFTMRGELCDRITLCSGQSEIWRGRSGASSAPAGSTCYIARVSGKNGTVSQRFMVNR
ncbi:MAG: carboxypeptidase regulatory-like domain-containing protein [Chitinispirillaceae bacterium]|nr:carboxypeptidase regulatory-like domain-containing protein [Chitinispirillaceae bacterium]